MKIDPNESEHSNSKFTEEVQSLLEKAEMNVEPAGTTSMYELYNELRNNIDTKTQPSSTDHFANLDKNKFWKHLETQKEFAETIFEFKVKYNSEVWTIRRHVKDFKLLKHKLH